ncbi:MAG: hypothetical protein ACSLFM_04940 [Tepidiformaceae bacterium]
MSAFAALKKLILSGAVALLILTGVIAPSAVSAASNPNAGWSATTSLVFQEGEATGEADPASLIPEDTSGDDDGTYISLAVASFAALTALGFVLAFYGFRER